MLREEWASLSVILNSIFLSSYRTTLKLLAVSAVGLALLVIAFAGQAILDSSSIELWYLHHSYLTTDEAVQKSKALIDQAVAAGYTGAVFWDSSLNMMGDSDWDPAHEARLKTVMNYARKRHLKMMAEVAPFGWSNDVLTANPNWAESQRVIGARFQVTPDGTSLKLQNSLPPLVNGNFDSAEQGWFELHDSNIKVVPNGHRGRPAVSIVDPPGNARLRQQVSVHPWRQYHLSLSYRASGERLGSPMVVVYDAANFDKVRFVVYLKPSEQWTDLDYLFNSEDSTEAAIYMGVWGGAKGTVQFAAVQLEETALVWAEHRDGAPFSVHDPEDSSKIYAAGVDYNEIADPQMRPSRWTFNHVFYTPPPFTLPPSTHLKPGQIVAVDYYAVTPLANDHQVGLCMTEPGVFQWLAINAKEVQKVAPQETGLLLAYDEIRHANSCFSCRAKKMTAGELLAWNFAETFGVYRQALPDSSFWVWSDMFDPFHNAHDNFYLVEGNLAGSWKGLPPEVSILNWNLDRLKDSLTWFSGRNPEQPVAHQQIIAGFYDKGDAAAEARSETANAAGIPGVRGLMYTTWTDDYSKLKVYADAARAAWPDYLKSVSGAAK